MATEYKVGQRVKLTAPMVNPNSTIMPIEDGMPAGLKGTIIHVNFEGHEELHQISVKWDNGRSLAILPYVDQFTVITGDNNANSADSGSGSEGSEGEGVGS